MGVIAFVTGALGYSALEFLFRGYTHWSMALTGGACLLTFYYYIKDNEKAPALAKAFVGACVFTVFEFFVGLLVNLTYHWNVWDYSGQPGNVMGQICPLYSAVWFAICFAISIISRHLHGLFPASQDGKQD